MTYYTGLYFGMVENKTIVFRTLDDDTFYGWIDSLWCSFLDISEADKTDRHFKQVSNDVAEELIFLEELG